MTNIANIVSHSVQPTSVAAKTSTEPTVTVLDRMRALMASRIAAESGAQPTKNHPSRRRDEDDTPAGSGGLTPILLLPPPDTEPDEDDILPPPSAGPMIVRIRIDYGAKSTSVSAKTLDMPYGHPPLVEQQARAEAAGSANNSTFANPLSPQHEVIRTDGDLPDGRPDDRKQNAIDIAAVPPTSHVALVHVEPAMQEVKPLSAPVMPREAAGEIPRTAESQTPGNPTGELEYRFASWDNQATVRVAFTDAPQYAALATASNERVHQMLQSSLNGDFTASHTPPINLIRDDDEAPNHRRQAGAWEQDAADHGEMG